MFKIGHKEWILDRLYTVCTGYTQGYVGVVFIKDKGLGFGHLVYIGLRGRKIIGRFETS